MMEFELEIELWTKKHFIECQVAKILINIANFFYWKIPKKIRCLSILCLRKCIKTRNADWRVTPKREGGGDQLPFFDF